MGMRHHKAQAGSCCFSLCLKLHDVCMAYALNVSLKWSLPVSVNDSSDLYPQAFAVLLFWYQLINGYSGSNPIDGVNLIMFNLAYTSLPIIIVGVADQDLRAEVLMKEKSLYTQGRLSKVYTRFKFWIAMLEAFYQSLVVFLVASSVSQIL